MSVLWRVHGRGNPSGEGLQEHGQGWGRHHHQTSKMDGILYISFEPFAQCSPPGVSHDCQAPHTRASGGGILQVRHKWR